MIFHGYPLLYSKNDMTDWDVDRFYACVCIVRYDMTLRQIQNFLKIHPSVISRFVRKHLKKMSPELYFQVRDTFERHKKGSQKYE